MNNFTFVGNFDISSFEKKISELTDDDWNDYTFRQNVFAAHKHTKTIPILFNEEFTDFPNKFKFYSIFENEINQLEKFLFDYYKKGKIIRCIITKLLAFQSIPPHTDASVSLIEAHRHHIPVKTNSKNLFTVNGEVKYLKAGEVWEIDNSLPHSVKNDSDQDRIHIIVDWNTKY